MGKHAAALYLTVTVTADTQEEAEAKANRIAEELTFKPWMDDIHDIQVETEGLG